MGKWLIILSLFLGGTSVAETLEEEKSPFEFSLSYIVDTLANVSGGVQTGTEVLGSLLLELGIDAEEAVGWTGGSFHFGVLGVHGGPFTDLVGDHQTVSNIEAPKTVNLLTAYYEQEFFSDRLSIAAGILNVDSEFDTRSSADLFVHSSPGTGGELGQLGENGPGIFPVGALGGRLRYRDDGWYGQLAMIEGVPGDPDDPFGTTLRIDKNDGLFFIGEFGHIWEDELGELGKACLGAWGFTADFPTLVDPDTEVTNRGAYVSLEKAFSREKSDASQGLSGYLRTGLAEGRVNPIETFVGAGLVYTGPFEGRNEDQIGAGINIGFVGQDFLKSGQFAGHETALELTYKFAVNEQLSVQPDLQYIINPGFDPTADNALVLGLRAHLRFDTP